MTGPGTTIAGRYRLVRQLGAGSMGAVWLAHDESLHREVAVKSVRGPLVEGDTASAEGEQRAMREARLIARVNHPNAVAIYDVVSFEGRPWLVMEYVPSQNLTELVREHGPLPPRRAAEIGAQLAAALAEAHAVGIVHRDVKPANVLISPHGLAKVTDFGVARGDDEVTLTASGAVWGTPAYLAPEVALGESPTQKADVWSLGATLYAAVEGAPPYGTDAGALALLGRIANQPVPPPHRAGPLAPVLARLLDRDPGGRPTMSHAGQMLRDVQAGVQPAPHDDTHDGTPTVPVAAVPPGRERRRRPAAILLVVLLALAVLAVGAFAWLARDPGGDAPAAQDSPPATDTPTSRPPTTQPEPSPTTQPEQTPNTPATPQSPQRTQTQVQSPSPTQRADGAFTERAMEQTVLDYYALMPDETEAGFQRLGPQLRAQGFDAYDDFWDGIESVRVSNVDAQPANRSVTATVVFQSDDGGTSVERHRFGLVRSGDELLINSDDLAD